MNVDKFIRQKDKDGTPKYWIGVYGEDEKMDVKDVVRAMEEYAQSKVKELEKIIELNKSTIQNYKEVDLGQQKIIQNLKEQVGALKSENAQLTSLNRQAEEYIQELRQHIESEKNIHKDIERENEQLKQRLKSIEIDPLPPMKTLYLDPNKVNIDDLIAFCGKENMQIYTGVTRVITKSGPVVIDSYDTIVKNDDGTFDVINRATNNPKQ